MIEAILILLLILQLGVSVYMVTLLKKQTSAINHQSNILGEQAVRILEQSENISIQSKLINNLENVENLKKENLTFKYKQKEIKELIQIILDTLQEDTAFIRSSFFQKLGSLTDYEEINGQIQKFQNRLEIIISTLRESVLNDEK